MHGDEQLQHRDIRGQPAPTTLFHHHFVRIGSKCTGEIEFCPVTLSVCHLSRSSCRYRLIVTRIYSVVPPPSRRTLSDKSGALAAFEEQRELAERLESEHSTDAVQSIVASSHFNIALVLFSGKGKPAEALASHGKALAIRQMLADANPAVTDFQSDLAKSQNEIGSVLWETGKPDEALASYRKPDLGTCASAICADVRVADVLATG